MIYYTWNVHMSKSQYRFGLDILLQGGVIWETTLVLRKTFVHIYKQGQVACSFATQKLIFATPPQNKDRKKAFFLFFISSLQQISDQIDLFDVKCFRLHATVFWFLCFVPDNSLHIVRYCVRWYSNYRSEL